jgi:cobaltochelatase CobS
MTQKLQSAKKLFNIPLDFDVPVFTERSEFVPEIDPTYCFDLETTKAILVGFIHNRRVIIQGYHGTGKSTHIEQVAARLNWPCIRLNLDSQISRLDLVGKDAIVLKDGLQVTEFQPGILPFSVERPIALVFDEYDAGRADVMFIIQRLLEQNGKLTLMEQNRVITPHKDFRMFATANTIGLGDSTGLYHGTQPINQGQLDRWNIVVNLNYIPEEQEEKILLAKFKLDSAGKKLIKQMITMANLTRHGFANGDVSTVMSPRTVISWVENWQIFGDVEQSFKLTFLNKCDDAEKPIFVEYYQRCFDKDIAVVKIA